MLQCLDCGALYFYTLAPRARLTSGNRVLVLSDKTFSSFSMLITSANSRTALTVSRSSPGLSAAVNRETCRARKSTALNDQTPMRTYLRNREGSPAHCNLVSAMEMRKWRLCLLLLSFLPYVLARCPSLCRCSANIIDCRGKELTEQNLPPSFPSSTEVIRLDQNHLVTIPNGLFDNLKQLREVHLQQNPWHCDCTVLYLRTWLQKQQGRALYKDVVCASPEQLYGRIVMYLTEDEVLSTCQYWYCNMALISQLCLFVFIAIQAILLIFVIVFLRRFQKIAKEARRTAKELYQNADNYTYDNYPAYNHGRT